MNKSQYIVDADSAQARLDAFLQQQRASQNSLRSSGVPVPLIASAGGIYHSEIHLEAEHDEQLIDLNLNAYDFSGT